MASVCDRMGLDGSDACLVQHAANALFRLPGAGVMLRLSTQPVDRLVRVARELSAAGVPVADLAPGVPQPVTADGWWATAWTLHPALPDRLPAAALAGPLAALHAVRLSGLPRWDLIGAIRAFLMPLAAADSTWAHEHLGRSMSELIGQLLTRCDEIERELAAVTWTLPVGTIHGDAHTGNLLRTAAGRVLLCDLDTVADGPREADLAPVAHGVARFGRDRADYESFADRYGFDLLGAPSWPALRRLRDLQMAVYMLPRPPADPVATGELAHRLRTLLEGDDDAKWYRYPAFF
ncbi:phosphotransferase family protein [Paractinoplanes globisporus]|uniref:Phosphotransferase family protein n=1 Tax=Paractinoplanes globisporus TaxID=113565 RepID=A0ABW6WT38_9ACTN|nr:phosphotransferase [Actinoplanes globisporus]